MADTQVKAHVAGPEAGGVMRRLNMFTGIAAGVILAVIGYFVSKALLPSPDDSPYTVNQVDAITMFCWVIGFMIGVGAFAGPFKWLAGRDQSHADEEFLAGKDQGTWRYLRFTTDHKVVGIQYLVTVMTMFAVGGTLAMLIRTELLRPGARLFGPQDYNTVVGLHGIIMIITTIIMVTGPFGNFIVPIMVGARDMAFPRLNALSYWTLFAALPVMLSSFFLGGIPTGWSAYAPLSDQAGRGMTSFEVAIITFAISSMLSGANLTTTVIRMRARGMTWNRTPIFVFGATTSIALGVVAFPMFMAAMTLGELDRTTGTRFYFPMDGGSAWLYSNLFWLMGHPEVYVILLPALAAIMEIAPVFTRKPLFSFNTAIIGIAGIIGLSLFVWAHHMYMAGWAPALNGPFMLTTEAISVPTGLLILVLVGTIWRGTVWTRLPKMAVYMFLWNFIIGGVTGIYLSDVPLDEAFHGALFVTAHFHYVLMGGALTGALGALVYWFPKMTGRMMNERIAGVGFWTVQAAFQVLFFAMFAVGMAGQPRRTADYPQQFAAGNMVASICAYIVGIGMLIFLYAVIHSWRNGEIAPANPWGAKTLEWQVPSPPPLENFTVLPVVTSDFYGYGEHNGTRPAAQPEAVPVSAGPTTIVLP